MMAQDAAAAAAGAAVPLRAVAVHAAEASYRQLAALVDTLPGRPEEERRRELMLMLHALRQRLLRLLVLVRWSPRAETALQFGRVREALASRDATFHDVANRLVAVHHTTAMEPVYDARAALRVLAAGRLRNAECLLPSSVEEMRPAQPPAPESGRLDAALRMRLLRTPLPARLRVLRLDGGLATLGIPHEFEVDLTLGPFRDGAAPGDAAPEATPAAPRAGGWVAVHVRLLVRAADATPGCALSEPHERRLCWELTRRMSASADPLGVVLFVLQELCGCTARDIAVKQAKAVCAGRWAGAVRLAALPGSPAPPGFALHYWQRPPRQAAGASGAAPAPASAVAGAPAGRALYVQLDQERRVVCVHEPPLGVGDAAGPQLTLDAISVDALLRAAVAAASLQQLTSVQAALRLEPALAALSPTELRRGDALEDPPALVLPFAADNAAPPSLRCDWRTGALRLIGAVPLLSAPAVRDLEESTARASAVEAASRMVSELWRRSVRTEVARLARALGMSPLASPKCALRYPQGSATPDVLLQLPPAGAALHLAVYLDATPTAQRAKLAVLAARPAEVALPVPADPLHLVPEALAASAAAGDWTSMLRAYADWAASHGARVAAEAQLAAMSAHFSVLAALGAAGAQLLLDANRVAPGTDSGVRVRFDGANEAAWEATLPDVTAQVPFAGCNGALSWSADGVRLRYAHMDEHLGGGMLALFADIRTVRSACNLWLHWRLRPLTCCARVHADCCGTVHADEHRQLNDTVASAHAACKSDSRSMGTLRVGVIRSAQPTHRPAPPALRWPQAQLSPVRVYSRVNRRSPMKRAGRAEDVRRLRARVPACVGLARGS
jgi:hypothetical protein